jgi:hypothetical protein
MTRKLIARRRPGNCFLCNSGDAVFGMDIQWSDTSTNAHATDLICRKCFEEFYKTYTNLFLPELDWAQIDFSKRVFKSPVTLTLEEEDVIT